METCQPIVSQESPKNLPNSFLTLHAILLYTLLFIFFNFTCSALAIIGIDNGRLLRQTALMVLPKADLHTKRNRMPGLTNRLIRSDRLTGIDTLINGHRTTGKLTDWQSICLPLTGLADGQWHRAD